MKSIKYILLGIVILCPVLVLSETIKVPTQYPTIQDAINAAQNGDTILVADGIYEGDINFNGIDFVIVKSESGPENCIIDCENQSFSIGFIFNSEHDKSVVEGFTIRNAMIGIWAYANSSPTIRNNIIEDCVTGINCGSEAKPIINSNIIKDCTGGGMYISNSSAIVSNNLINNNSASKGGGIYCYYSTPSIINNTIVGNSGIETSASGVEGDPILRCEYDNFNRIYECFVLVADNISGGGIYLQNSSPDIINNIIAFSKGSQEATEPSSGLTRWYSNDLFMRYNYEVGKLNSVTYYYGFKNNGEPGDVHLYSSEKGGCHLDTTFTIQSGELYWVETTSFVSLSGDYGGLKLTAHMGDDSLKVSVVIDNPLFAGCYYLYDTHIQSHGIVQGETGGTGIIAVGDNSFLNISYNNIYGNGGGNYLVGETSEVANVIDLTGVDGNISNDPLFNENEYSLTSGSPCLDAGTPNTSGLNIGDTDLFGNSRIIDGNGDGIAVIDIGAFEFVRNPVGIKDEITIDQSEKFCFSIMPNPNNGIFNFKINSNPPEKFTIKLVDGLGQVIIIQNINNPTTNQIEQFDVSHLGKGVYYLVITTAKFRESRKIVIQ